MKPDREFWNLDEMNILNSLANFHIRQHILLCSNIDNDTSLVRLWESSCSIHHTLYHSNRFNSTLDVSAWACQCECNQSDSSDIAYGEYCSLTLTDEQAKCHYRCLNTEECAVVYESWQESLIYSSHPNFRTPDPVSFYEYQFEHAVSSSYSKLGIHLSVASFFLCMDHANGTSVSELS
jgi:hypothetical protein